MKRTIIHVLSGMTLAACTVLVGCATQGQATNPLAGYQQLSANDSQLEEAIGAIRYQGLRDAALSVGARGGLAWRAKKINAAIEPNEIQLSRVFNFQLLMLDKQVLPPVVIEGRDAMEHLSDADLRISDRQYAIIQQAKFATAPPTWRDYLYLQYESPEPPDRSLLPRNRAEQTIWRQYVREGWAAGVAQADAIFYENLGRLKRDFNGMVLYRTLLANNMVSAPFVAHSELGITQGNDQMSVNDQLYKITVLPQFNGNGQSWKSLLIPLTQVKKAQTMHRLESPT